MQRGTQTSPSWLEVERSGTATLVGQFVGSGGSARPIAKIEFTDGTFRFAIPPQWESNPRDITFEGRLEGDRITGSMTMGDGQKVTWSGTRAPSLRRAEPPAWGEPVTLFNGNVTRRVAAARARRQPVERGRRHPAEREAAAPTSSRFRSSTTSSCTWSSACPKARTAACTCGAATSCRSTTPPASSHRHIISAGVYGFIAPSENVAKAAGEWQSMDVTLVGRMLTYELNGTTVICNREIPGITGGALDSAEAEPGPLLLQGDHGPVDYRNIVITPAKSAR